VSVEVKGERELTARFEQFPQKAKERLRARITEVVRKVQARAEAAAPQGKTGVLKSEITSRVYTDSPHRVAGYVSVVAHDDPKKQYPKAGALEYGIKGTPRKVFERPGLAGRLGMTRRRIVDRVTKPVVMRAYRYLRDPMEATFGEAQAAIAQALEEAANEGEGTG
jgi:hypothetical protein